VGRPLIYLDANVVIRLVEGDAATRAPLVARLTPSLGVPGSLATSRLTRLECRSKPLRAGDLATVTQFDVFFAGVELVLAEVTAAVVERATDLRARYNLKTPDALHYATAVEVAATVFLTGDRGLARCSGVAVEVL
jgi:predicted nucleic acid-binding protein